MIGIKSQLVLMLFVMPMERLVKQVGQGMRFQTSLIWVGLPIRRLGKRDPAFQVAPVGQSRRRIFQECMALVISYHLKIVCTFRY